MLYSILGEQFANAEPTTAMIDTGTVVSLADGIARVYGVEA